MNSITLTEQVETLRARMTEVAESYGPTDQAGLRALTHWYLSAVRDSARQAIYGDRYAALALSILNGEQPTDRRREDKVESLVREVWTFILNRATASKEKLTANAAREIAFRSDEVAPAVKSESKSWTRYGTATFEYRDDLKSMLSETAARAISKKTVDGTASPVSGNQHRYPIMDLPLIEQFVAHLATLVERAGEADRQTLGFSGDSLSKNAGNLLDSVRYGFKVTQAAGREARALAGAKARFEGDDEALAAFRADRMAEAEASEGTDRESKIQAVLDAEDVLALRSGVSFDLDEGAPVIAAQHSDTDREEALGGALGSIWDRLAPQFGFATGADLEIAIAWLTDEAERSTKLTEFYARNASKVKAAQRKARALDIGAVQDAMRAEMLAV